MAQLVHRLKRSHIFYHSSDKWYNNIIYFFNISGPSLGLFLCPFLYALPFVYFLKKRNDFAPNFVGKDVAEILGYQNGSRDVNRHVVDEEDKLKYRFGTSPPSRLLPNTSAGCWVNAFILPIVRIFNQATSPPNPYPMTPYKKLEKVARDVRQHLVVALQTVI